MNILYLLCSFIILIEQFKVLQTYKEYGFENTLTTHKKIFFMFYSPFLLLIIMTMLFMSSYFIFKFLHIIILFFHVKILLKFKEDFYPKKRSSGFYDSSEVITYYEWRGYMHKESSYRMSKIEVSKIIGLSRKYNRFVNDERMEDLKNSIQKKGWKNSIEDSDPIKIIQCPKGYYFINENGNHRTLWAIQNNIEYLYAEVTILTKEK